MYEVELKVRAAHDRVREALEAAGADRIGRVEQTDTYFDAPHRDFEARDEALRIRAERTDGETQAFLTYKGPRIEEASKTRREVETTVGSAEAGGDVFAALGFEPAATVEKTRDRYRLGGFTVSLDSVSGLGEFVEIEAEAREAAVEETRTRAESVLVDLGLDPSGGIRTSYLGLLLEGE